MDPWLFAPGWARPHGRATAKVHFRDTVPCRADRRELRRLLRRAARSEKSATDGYVAETLHQLATRRVQVATVWLRSDGSEVVQFNDGTDLVVDVAGNVLMIDRLRGERFRGVRLGQATPRVGHSSYRLWFVPAAGEAVEVMAKVSAYQPASAPSASPRRRWLRRHQIR